MRGKVTEGGRVALAHSEEEVAKAHAEAFNEMPCVAEGRCAKKEAKPTPNGRSWRFLLYAADLEELGVAYCECRLMGGITSAGRRAGADLWHVADAPRHCSKKKNDRFFI